MKISIIEEGKLEAISKALGDTAEGLTGSEINALLLQAKICNPDPLLTKWKRLFTAFLNQQKIVLQLYLFYIVKLCLKGFSSIQSK